VCLFVPAGYYMNKLKWKCGPRNYLSKNNEMISSKGYVSTVASLRVFMKKERTQRQSIEKQSETPMEYLLQKFMCQLIYRKLEK
jgi:hypothetical protein